MNGHYLANNVQVIKVIQLNPSLKISISYFQELSTQTYCYLESIFIIKVIQLNPSLKTSLYYFQELSTQTSTGITISFLGKAQTQNH
jgi:hypothetical protein